MLNSRSNTDFFPLVNLRVCVLYQWFELFVCSFSCPSFFSSSNTVGIKTVYSTDCHINRVICVAINRQWHCVCVCALLFQTKRYSEWAKLETEFAEHQSIYWMDESFDWGGFKMAENIPNNILMKLDLHAANASIRF